MPNFHPKWLKGPVDLAPLPIRGEREVRAVELRNSDVEAFASDYRFYTICKGLLAAEHVVTRLGAAKAKESWDEWLLLTFSVAGSDGPRLAPGFKDFIWPLEDFEYSLKATKETFISRRLAAKDDEDAKTKLDIYGKEIAARAESISKESIEQMGKRPLLSLYWRLRASGVDSIILPTGEHAIDWSLEQKAATIELLSEVVSPLDLQSLDGPTKERTLDLKELLPQSAADVEGKSGTSSDPSTQSSPDSAHFSVATTAIPTR